MIQLWGIHTYIKVYTPQGTYIYYIYLFMHLYIWWPLWGICEIPHRLLRIYTANFEENVRSCLPNFRFIKSCIMGPRFIWFLGVPKDQSIVF